MAHRTPCLLAATLALALACASPRTLEQAFVPPPAAGGDAPLVETLRVAMGADERPLQGRTSLGRGFLVFLPLVPYGHQQIPPDRFTSSFEDDVVRTVVADLRAARVARLVLEEDDRLPGEAAPEAAHRLVVTLDEGTMHRKVTLYGLSFVGAFLWFVGAPVSFGDSEIALTATLYDPQGDTIGEESFRADSGFAEGLYYNPFAPTATARLGDAFGDLSPALRRFVRTSLRPAR